MTSKQYELILSHAKSICFSKYNLKKNIDPNELVMQVYSDSQDIINDPLFVDLIKKRVTHYVNFRGFDRFEFINDIKHCKCNRCKAKKPVSAFQTFKNKFTKQEDCVSEWCKDCVKSYHKKYYNTKHGKETRNRNFNKYVERNRDSWNKYIKERFDKEKELLSDRYIKKILPFKVSEITPEMIEKKRDEIKHKRLKLT